MMKQILIIEDDQALAKGITLALQDDNIKLFTAETLVKAEKLLFEKEFDLLILDINLPDGNGLDLLKTVRKNSAVPVILLTANDLETDVVLGFEMGADDYITKPFSLAILRARVKSKLRQRRFAAKEQLRIDDFYFDFSAMMFKKQEVPIELSKTEQKLLAVLIANRGNVVPRSVLSEKIWNNGLDYVDENALSVAVKRLRDKLEDNPAAPVYIKTVYGIGYVWALK